VIALPTKKAMQPVVRLTHRECGCVREVPIVSLDATTAMLGQPVQCPDHPPCACRHPKRAGGHPPEACGLADGSVRGARRDEKDAEAQLVKGVA
jgi:hypothetical protein